MPTLEKHFTSKTIAVLTTQYTVIITLAPQIVNIKLGYLHAFVKKQRDRKSLEASINA